MKAADLVSTKDPRVASLIPDLVFDPPRTAAE